MMNRGVWAEDEHDRFLESIQVYPHGPWRYVAKHVGTRDVRQVQTHAQKYYEKVGRHMRGLRKERRSWIRSEHRIDDLPPGLQRDILSPSSKSSGSKPSPAPSSSSSSSSSPKTQAHRALKPRASVIHSPLRTEDSASAMPILAVGCLGEARQLSTAAHPAMAMKLPSFEESLDILIDCLSDY